MYDEDATVFTAMQAGARGYLLKGAEQDEIADAIRAVVRGQAIFGAAIASRMLEHFANPPAPAAPDDPFPELTAAGEGDPRAARPRSAYRGDRRDPAPVAEDGQQQPDHDLRQARGGRPDRRGDPGPRARPGRLGTWTSFDLAIAIVAVSTGGSGLALLLRRQALVSADAARPAPEEPPSPRPCCWRRGTTTRARSRLVLAVSVLAPAALATYPRLRWRHPVDFVSLVVIVGCGVVGVVYADPGG